MRVNVSLFATVLCILFCGNSIALYAQAGPSSVFPGQALTMLSDGSILGTGGINNGKSIATAVLFDRKGRPERLSSNLISARADHTATLLPNGKVLIFGGIDSKGLYLRTMELYDPSSKSFSSLSGMALMPRSKHSATLLPSGRVVVMGGKAEGGTFAQDIQFWNYADGSIESVETAPSIPREGHRASLLADGTVLIEGGRDIRAVTVKQGEVFDPTTRRFRLLAEGESPATVQDSPLQLTISLPKDGDESVSLAIVPAICLSNLVSPSSVSTASVILSDVNGETVTASPIVAERGRLVFVNPASSLKPDTAYTLFLNGLTDGSDNAIQPTVIHFHTEATEDDGSGDGWRPGADALNGNWNSNTGLSKWQQLPALRAKPGVTALSGQVLAISGRPLPHVSLQIDHQRVESDSTGRFLLEGLSPGHHVFIIDGGTATKRNAEYGLFEDGVDLRGGVTNVLNYTIWMTRLDKAHAVRIPSPTTASDTVITNPLLPGLELHLPKGSTVVDRNGRPVKELTITPIPLDKTPFPLPTGLKVPLYFTVQPGGGSIEVEAAPGATVTGARLFYPNSYKEAAGTDYSFWNYDAAAKGWYIYGDGHVTASGSNIVPDPGVYVYDLTGAMVGGQTPKPPRHKRTPKKGGDPVDLGSGLFVYSNTDLELPDVMPIELVRTYTTNDHLQRSFGIGTSSNYDIFMVGDTFPYTYQELIEADGNPIRFNRTSPGTSYADAVYLSSSEQGMWYGATLAWNMDVIPGATWIVTTRTGMQFGFPDAFQQNDQFHQALTGIKDRNGNQIILTRDSNAILTGITSPMGRSITLSHDPQNRITKAVDNANRTVSYTYDSASHIATVTDPNGGVTTLSYDANDLMTSIKDPRGITYLSNEYDSFGRVIKQTQADGGTYQFDWTPTSNSAQEWVSTGAMSSRYDSSSSEGYPSLISQVSVTDPRGYTRQVSYNGLSMQTSETLAVGQPEQQTTTFQYYADNSLSASVDAIGRTTSFDYDTNGNLSTVTALAGTSNATTITATYDPVYSNIVSITDPLNHTYSFTYDSHGNLIQTQDPLGNGWTLAHNNAGQTVSATDAAGDSTTYTYNGGDLVSITDPLGNSTTRFIDAAGRVSALSDARSHVTQFTYDNLDQVLSRTDPLGNQTAYTYDLDGGLVSVTDPRGGLTQYTYDSMERPLTVTDPLTRVSQATYDLGGNRVAFVDNKGLTTNRAFDGIGRNIRTDFGTTGTGTATTYESTVSYNYDAANRLIGTVDSTSGNISRSFDGLNRLMSETTPQGSISYTYNAAGRLRTAQPPVGSLISYSYDDAGQVLGLSQGTTSVALSYDPAGRRSALTLPNGIVTQYAYDADSRVQGLTYMKGSNLFGTLLYTYDQAGREVGVGGTLAATNLPSTLGAATYDAANQLLSWDGATQTYDADGNTINDVLGHQFHWNARNQLIGVTGQTSSGFGYDSFGRRTTSLVNAQTVSYQYDGSNRISESAGTEVASLLPGGLDEYFQRSDSSGTTFPITDNLGGTLGMTDSSGTLATRYTYDPYGVTAGSGAFSGNAGQYAGRENDQDGLYYYRARYYSPATARFISQDPLGFFAGNNFYQYVGGDPVDFNDPFGFDRRRPRQGPTPPPHGPNPPATPNPPQDPNKPPAPTPNPNPPDPCAGDWGPGADAAMAQAAATAPSTRSNIGWTAGGGIAGASGGPIGIFLGALGGFFGNNFESASYGMQAAYAQQALAAACSPYSIY